MIPFWKWLNKTLHPIAVGWERFSRTPVWVLGGLLFAGIAGVIALVQEFGADTSERGVHEVSLPSYCRAHYDARPSEVGEDHIFVHRNAFSFLKNFPFDLYLSRHQENFLAYHSGLVREVNSPSADISAFDVATDNLDLGENGHIDTMQFIFFHGSLRAIHLKMTINPAYESKVFEHIQSCNTFALSEGNAQAQASDYVWLKRNSPDADLIYWRHGMSSGSVTLLISDVDFIVNGTLGAKQSFYSDTGNLSKGFSGYTTYLQAVLGLLRSDAFQERVMPAMGYAAVSAQYAEAQVAEWLPSLETLSRAWGTDAMPASHPK